MASIHEDGVYEVTFKANQDLSAYQYFAVTSASVSGYVKLATGASAPAPIGIIQNDTASNVGDAVRIKTFGHTKARVAAATSAGTACDVDMGDHLLVTASGFLFWGGGGGPYNAIALDFLDSGCSNIEVFFFPWAACSAGDDYS